MELVRRHPVAAAAVVAALLVLVALVVPLPGGSGDGPAGGPGAAGPDGGTPTVPRPTSSPSMTTAAEAADATSGLVRPSVVRAEEPTGLSGSGGVLNVRAHRITLSVRSSDPIGVVGYNIPTSRDRPSGVVRGVGRSWSLSTRVYGRPDYAQMFLQAGPASVSMTCTITVDGKVTEQRTTTGPYGQLFCQG
ncbi:MULTISPECIES: hypothetical protein [unclassified Aeromicrobium]|uniref:hypothetical protein n=1 Tax=unclassified Aeromicrobium TaxID=2633570 RepID=UPI00288A8B68|nr:MULTISPECIES: hypothetical protein [unclassified Aeromicrobium]